MTHPLLAALRASLAGRMKAVACETWPSLSHSSAESRLSRVLDGSLAIPPRLLELAVTGPEGSHVLDYLRAIHDGDATELRREALREIHEAREQLSLAFERLGQADKADAREHERKPALRSPMVRVEPKRRREDVG